MKLADSYADHYEIIPDGQQFAITIRGEIELDGLDCEDMPKAQCAVAILNHFIECERAG
jgi:hypothetical protein